jgi:gamma-glutamyltranspeptidase / glutathione hydrolase
VVEPEASGIGGDGMAILYLKGMAQPIVVDYKDQVPIRATSDNPRLRQNTGDGPLAANIPGVVAGMDYLYQRYGSKHVAWADLIGAGDRVRGAGFRARRGAADEHRGGPVVFREVCRVARIFLPGGRVPRPGERFINTDYGATLRTIAKDGAQAFYRGRSRSGSLPTWRARRPDRPRRPGAVPRDRAANRSRARYRDYAVFSTPPPVSTGLSLIETLQILQNYRPGPGAAYAADADFLHYAIESGRCATRRAASRTRRCGRSISAAPRRRARGGALQADRPWRAPRGPRAASGDHHARAGPSGSAAARRRSPWRMPTAT